METPWRAPKQAVGAWKPSSVAGIKAILPSRDGQIPENIWEIIAKGIGLLLDLEGLYLIPRWRYCFS